MQCHENLVFIAKATDKGSDEPAHPHSLIIAFTANAKHLASLISSASDLYKIIGHWQCMDFDEYHFLIC